MEQEELEGDLLEVGEPTHNIAIDDPIDELPEVRKYLITVCVLAHTV